MPFPNFPAHISMTKVDYVVVVDAIGDPKKIATGAAKPTKDMRKLMMADYCTRFVTSTRTLKMDFLIRPVWEAHLSLPPFRWQKS